MPHHWANTARPTMMLVMSTMFIESVDGCGDETVCHFHTHTRMYVSTVEPPIKDTIEKPLNSDTL